MKARRSPHALADTGWHLAAMAPSERSRRHELEELEAYGTQWIIISSDEDPRRCPACARIQGVVMALSAAPSLPVSSRRGDCTCRLAPVSLE